MNFLDYFGINTAEASTSKVSPTADFVGRVNNYLVNPLIILMFAVALLYFLYGVFEFITNADKPEEREIGQSHIMWGVIGMFIMFAVFAILHIIENTLGISANPNIP